MDRARFTELVDRVVEELPPEIKTMMENVDVVVEDRPSAAQCRELGLRRGETLYGLYEGVPQTNRGWSYGLVAPDKITIFQRPIEDKCRRCGEVEEEVRAVVLHEIAHHFGIDEDRLAELGLD